MSTNNGHGQATLIERLRLYREELDREIERHGRNATYHHEQARHYADGVVQASHGAASSISSAAHAALIEARASFDGHVGGAAVRGATAEDVRTLMEMLYGPQPRREQVEERNAQAMIDGLRNWLKEKRMNASFDAGVCSGIAHNAVDADRMQDAAPAAEAFMRHVQTAAVVEQALEYLETLVEEHCPPQEDQTTIDRLEEQHGVTILRSEVGWTAHHNGQAVATGLTLERLANDVQRWQAREEQAEAGADAIADDLVRWAEREFSVTISEHTNGVQVRWCARNAAGEMVAHADDLGTLIPKVQVWHQAQQAHAHPLTPAEAGQIAELSRNWHVRIERTMTDWRAYDQHNGDQHVATTHDISQMEQALDLCRGGTDRTRFRYRIGRRDDPESGILWFATRLDDNRNAAIVLDTLENLAIAMEMVVTYDVRVIQQRYRDHNGNCCYAEMGKTYFPTRSLADLRTELERLQEFRVDEDDDDQAASLPPCHLSITAVLVHGQPFWVVQDHSHTTPDGRPFIVFDGGHGDEGLRRCAAHLEAEALKRSEERAEDDAPF